MTLLIYAVLRSFILAAHIFRAASERTVSKKTYLFILLIKLLSLIHFCSLRL